MCLNMCELLMSRSVLPPLSIATLRVLRFQSFRLNSLQICIEFKESEVNSAAESVGLDCWNTCSEGISAS